MSRLLHRSRIDRLRTVVVSLGLLALLSAGCASTKIDSQQRADPNDVVRPSMVAVYDFAVSADDVVLDTFGPEFMSGTGSQGKREDAAHQIARNLSTQLVGELRKRGISAELAHYDRVPPMDAVLVKGQFVTIDEGDQVKRMTIGLGAGASKLQARVQVYQMTGSGPRRIAQAEATAQGSKMPGMAIPVGAGAAAGSAATAAIVSGGMNVAREVKGAMSEDTGKIAEKIADRFETFYEEQGWL